MPAFPLNAWYAAAWDADIKHALLPRTICGKHVVMYRKGDGSVAALEGMTGRKVDPLRFRANLYVDGWPAWGEFDLLDQILAIGSARLKVIKRTVRCAATNVDPQTAARDMTIPATLQQTLGHADCGVYAEVIEAGAIAQGDAVRVEQAKLLE